MLPHIDVRGHEKSDWGHICTLRSGSLVTCAEWVRSAYFCRLRLHGNDLVGPNRDHPYQELSLYHDGQHWRPFEGKFFTVGDSTADSVHLNPWEATYHYRAVDAERIEPKLPILCSAFCRLFSFCCAEMNPPSLRTRRMRVVVQPFLGPVTDRGPIARELISLLGRTVWLVMVTKMFLGEPCTYGFNSAQS